MGFSGQRAGGADQRRGRGGFYGADPRDRPRPLLASLLQRRDPPARADLGIRQPDGHHGVVRRRRRRIAAHSGNLGDQPLRSRLDTPLPDSGAQPRNDLQVHAGADRRPGNPDAGRAVGGKRPAPLLGPRSENQRRGRSGLGRPRHPQRGRGDIPDRPVQLRLLPPVFRILLRPGTKNETHLRRRRRIRIEAGRPCNGRSRRRLDVRRRRRPVGKPDQPQRGRFCRRGPVETRAGTDAAAGTRARTRARARNCPAAGTRDPSGYSCAHRRRGRFRLYVRRPHRRGGYLLGQR